MDIPTGVAVRRATERDVEGIARVHVASWQSAYRGIMPDAFLDGLRVENRAAMWRRVLGDLADRHVVFVAESPEEGVVGFASAGPTIDETLPYDGELHAIYLLASVQGHGLGRRLVRAVAAELAARGVRSLCLWVLADNPSRGFYERLGGRAVGAKTEEIGGATLDEIAYGWDDLGSLVSSNR
jgi:L-amino acid N-acyltransferase YncA